jgi:DNA-binding beta-propeller fold protein YncE
LRVIQGPKTRLNWPTALAVHPDRGEVFVANDVGDAVTVFRTDANGDVAPIRVLKGPHSLIKNPTGLAVDVTNNELWVANFGNHSATVYRIDAAGDVVPLRVIRSAPMETPAPMLSNAHVAVFDTKRKEVLVAN